MSHFAPASARSLVKVYGSGPTTVRALDRVSVDFTRGQLTAIMGPSGSGKSTLMHCMAGLDTPTSGSAMVNGKNVSRMTRGQLTKLRQTDMGFIFQAYNLVPTLTAAENITLPLDVARRRIDRSWFREVVQVVGLTGRLHHRPHELSGGQQQRVACARALLARPAVVFADEPTGNLDSRSAADVLGFLRDSTEQYGQSIAMVTHDPRAASYAHRVVFLADGRLVGELIRPTSRAVLDALDMIAGSQAATSAPHPVGAHALPSAEPGLPTPAPHPVGAHARAAHALPSAEPDHPATTSVPAASFPWAPTGATPTKAAVGRLPALR